MTQPQPKTQAELQERVLEVLRRKWPEVHLDDDTYELAVCGDESDGHLDLDGDAHGLVNGLYGTELDALAEASRLLRDGVAKPSRVDRALEVLRGRFYHADTVTNYDYPEHVSVDLKIGGRLSHNGVKYGLAGSARLYAEDLDAISAALRILNAPGDE